jgi:hypothetical protein
VTYASAIEPVDYYQLQILSSESGYSAAVRIPEGWEVNPREIYILEKFQQSNWINHPRDEFSVLRMDDVVLVLRTSNIVLIRPNSPEYERAETLYKAQVKDKREEEKAAEERAKRP